MTTGRTIVRIVLCIGCVALDVSCASPVPTYGTAVSALTAQGATGAIGISGSPGPAGATGATGAEGSLGPTGLAGATGSAGALGATGSAGTVGSTGTTGAVGAAGVAGSVGATGSAGHAGATGTSGAPGITGAAGAAGSTGAAGVTGAGAAGATGMTGAKGTTGARGATGAEGSQGPNGSIGAAGIAGTAGDVGTTGSVGATGTKGVEIAGAVGATGDVGIDWGQSWSAQSYPTGSVVVDPANGGAYGATIDCDGSDEPALSGTGCWMLLAYPGLTGTGGTQGSAGAEGSAGAAGAVGATGATGITGIQWAGAWSAQSYSAGSVVSDAASGSVFVWTADAGCVTESPAESVTLADGCWQEVSATGGLGATGSTGLAGLSGVVGATGAVFRGAWSSVVPYSQNDLVTSDGATYVAENGSPTGAPPGNGWSLVAEEGIPSNGGEGFTGATGAVGGTGAHYPNPGPVGSTGAIGSMGSTGADGASPTGPTGATGPTSTATGANGAGGPPGPTSVGSFFTNTPFAVPFVLQSNTVQYGPTATVTVSSGEALVAAGELIVQGEAADGGFSPFYYGLCAQSGSTLIQQSSRDQYTSLPFGSIAYQASLVSKGAIPVSAGIWTVGFCIQLVNEDTSMTVQQVSGWAMAVQ